MPEVIAVYDFSYDIKDSPDDLLAIEQQVLPKGLINLDKIIKFCRNKRSHIYIKAEELRYIDELIVDEFVNRLLSYEGYTPGSFETKSCMELPPRNWQVTAASGAIKQVLRLSGYAGTLPGLDVL